MKCPFCQQPIVCMDAQDADEHSTWYCPRCIAEKAWYAFGNDKLWQALIDTKNQLTVERTTHDILQEELKKLQKELADTKKKLDRAIRVIQEVSKMSDKLSRKYGDTLVEQLDTIQAFCWEQVYILTHDEDFKRTEQINETKGGKDDELS